MSRDKERHKAESEGRRLLRGPDVGGEYEAVLAPSLM